MFIYLLIPILYMSQDKTHERDPESFKEKKSFDLSLKMYHDLNEVGRISDNTTLEKVNSLSKALIDLIESQEDLTIVDRIHIMQNTTLRLIYKNTLEYLDYKERQVKKQMCEDLK